MSAYAFTNKIRGKYKRHVNGVKKLLELRQATISKRGANFLSHSKKCEFRFNHGKEGLVPSIRGIFKK
jgi:hypothetical protein